MSRKILIVDDEAHLRTLIQQTLEELEDEGVELHTRHQRRRGAGRDRVDAAEPGVPRRDDAEAEWLRRLRARQEDARADERLHRAADREGPGVRSAARRQEVGADLYMTKPFDPDALLVKARDVLGL